MTALVTWVSRVLGSSLVSLAWLAFRGYHANISDLLSFEKWNAIPLLELLLTVAIPYILTVFEADVKLAFSKVDKLLTPKEKNITSKPPVAVAKSFPTNRLVTESDRKKLPDTAMKIK